MDLDYWYGAPLTGTHRHTYQVTAQTAATCTQPGQTTYTCACGATKTETTAALGHNYGAWTTYTAPTCTVAGMERSVCTRCAAYQERTVAATGVHKWDAGVLVQEATCTEDGCRRYTCTQCGTTKDETLPAAGHSYEKGKCTVCGQRDPELLLGDLIEMQFTGTAYNPHLGSAIALVMMIIVGGCRPARSLPLRS